MENQLLVQHFEFNDFDRFSEMIKQGKLEQSQLNVGDFRGSLSHITHGPINISRHKMNQTILQKGSGNEGNIIFMIPGNMEQRINWRKHDLLGNCIGILKFGMEHESVTLPNFFGFSVSISTNYLAELSVLLGFSRFMEIVKTSELVVIKKVDATEIQSMISNIFNTKLFVEYKLSFQLPKLIIASISNMDQKIQNYSDRSQNLIFRNAQSYIEYNIREKINILNLSKELGISGGIGKITCPRPRFRSFTSASLS